MDFYVRAMGNKTKTGPKMSAEESKKKVLGLRVSSDANQGGRDHMEDMISIRYERGQEHDCAFLGIFDGHGGKQAAVFARDMLWDHIKAQRGFDSKDPERVKQAISDGFLKTQEAMWKRRGTWGTTKSGYPSTSGTTACVAIIRQGQLWVAHVGDSRAVLGVLDSERGGLRPCTVTTDHKPESPREMERIRALGGQVQAKNGVQRVVWQRTRLDHSGPVRRSTNVDSIPFLAVARSLGDLWSYSTLHNDYVVSPKPDISYRVLNPKVHQCLVMGTDGLWNMLSSSDSIYILSKYCSEKKQGRKMRETMAQRLVKNAVNRWVSRSLRADNTTAITIVFDFPKEKSKPATDTPDKTTEQPVEGESGADCSVSPGGSDSPQSTPVGEEGGSGSPKSPEGAKVDEDSESAGTKLVIRGETDFVGVQGFGNVRPKLRHSNMYRDFVFRFHYPEPEKPKLWGWDSEETSWRSGGKEEEDEDSDIDYWQSKPWKPDGKRYINTPVVEVTNRTIHQPRPSTTSPWLSEDEVEPPPRKRKRCDCFHCRNAWTDFCLRKPVAAHEESAIKRHNIEIIREYKLKPAEEDDDDDECRCRQCSAGNPKHCLVNSPGQSGTPRRRPAKRRRASSPKGRRGPNGEFRQNRYNTRSSPTQPELPLAQRALRSLNKGTDKSPGLKNHTTPKKRLTRPRRAPIKSC